MRGLKSLRENLLDKMMGAPEHRFLLGGDPAGIV
jgi:hypothetical protein